MQSRKHSNNYPVFYLLPQEKQYFVPQQGTYLTFEVALNVCLNKKFGNKLQVHAWVLASFDSDKRAPDQSNGHHKVSSIFVPVKLTVQSYACLSLWSTGFIPHNSADDHSLGCNGQAI